MENVLHTIANNLRAAKEKRTELAKNISILKRMGGSVGTAETDLHNLDIKIAKQEEVLREEGIVL